MAYSGKQIANEFLELASGEKDEITPMKMQKLLYFSHGWYLAGFGERLLNDTVEAWKFGPVIPSVYHEFKSFGMNCITRKARSFQVNEKGGFSIYEPVVPKEDSIVRGFLKNMWDFYKPYSGVQLSNATHLKGTPWYEAWHMDGGKDRVGQDISDEKISAYFKVLLGKVAAAPAKA